MIKNNSCRKTKLICRGTKIINNNNNDKTITLGYYF